MTHRDVKYLGSLLNVLLLRAAYQICGADGITAGVFEGSRAFAAFLIMIFQKCGL